MDLPGFPTLRSQESTLPNQLRSCLAELNPENGSHIIFEQPQDGIEDFSLCLPIFFGEVLLEIQICYVCNVQARVSQNKWQLAASCECFFMSSCDMTMFKAKGRRMLSLCRGPRSCWILMHQCLRNAQFVSIISQGFRTPVLPLQEPWTQNVISRQKPQKLHCLFYFHPFPDFPALWNNPISLHRTVCILIIATWRKFMPSF